MDIDGLAESIGLEQEEIDFYTWLKESKNQKIHFGQKIKIKNKPFFIVGGTLDGNLFCQQFPARTHISKIRFDKSKQKIVIPWKVFISLVENSKKK